jgi:CheY-like chemotaxis protein
MRGMQDHPRRSQGAILGCFTICLRGTGNAHERAYSFVEYSSVALFGGASVIFATGDREPVHWRTVPAGYKEGDDVKKLFRILIADDHEAVRRGLKAALTGAGWVVCGEATDGLEAIEKAAELKPDLIVLDVTMPNLGGLDAAREILKSGNGVKIVVFTMHESRQIREETAAIGAHALAVKSAPLSALLTTIDSLLLGAQ